MKDKVKALQNRPRRENISLQQNQPSVTLNSSRMKLMNWLVVTVEMFPGPGGYYLFVQECYSTVMG